MERRELNRFAAATSGASIDNHIRLAIARDLARIYNDVLDEPLPSPLQHLISKLSSETRNGAWDDRRHS
jgi:hypothetical protein